MPWSLVKSHQGCLSLSCALCSQLHLCKVAVNCYSLWADGVLSCIVPSIQHHKKQHIVQDWTHFSYSQRTCTWRPVKKYMKTARTLGRCLKDSTTEKTWGNWRQLHVALLSLDTCGMQCGPTCLGVVWSVRLCRELNSLPYRTWV